MLDGVTAQDAAIVQVCACMCVCVRARASVCLHLCMRE